MRGGHHLSLILRVYMGHTPSTGEDTDGMQDTLAALIAGWMTLHGYPPPLQHALLQRIQVESRFDPNVVASSGSACLMQWVATRRVGLYNYAGTRSCPPWQKQLEWMDHELRTIPAFRVLWSVNEGNAYSMVTAIYSNPGGRHHRRRNR